MSKLYYLLISVFFVSVSLTASGQSTITGTINDKDNGGPVPGVVIMQKGGKSTVTDANGKFTLEVNTKEEVTIETSHIGYEKQVFKLKPGVTLTINLEQSSHMASTVVVTGSRVSEKIFESPVTVYKIDAKAVQSSASGDFYQSMGNLPGVDVVNTSFGMKMFNTRGFNTTSPFRTVQLVDGIDGITPVLNFSPGNVLGITDIDIKNMEIVSGPSSAMYGPNAMQGIINISSFTPFDKQGLTIQLKGGTRSYGDVQARYAKVIGKKQRFGVKVVASYFRAKEWVADDPVLNTYRPRPGAPVNMNNLLNTLAADTTLPASTQALLDSFVTYTQTNANALPGTVSYTVPGYKETDLVPEPVTYSFKISPAVYYKITDSLEISYMFRFSQQSAIYQGNNRAFFKDFTFSQHKLELRGKNFFIKGFINTDNVANTYDLVLTGISMGQQQVGAYNSAYLLNYINNISTASGSFANAVDSAAVAGAKGGATTAAGQTWVQPGTEAFNNLFNATVSSTNRPVGSRYISNSSIWQVDGQYNYKNKIVDVGVGAMFRRYIPRTEGRLFADTMQQDGTYRKISYNEIGGYVQLYKGLLDNKIKLTASLRLDKSQNYDLQYSPRFSASVTIAKRHNIRVALQSAFRTPSLNDQYFLLNVGAFTVRGNVTGYDNLYTASSVAAYQAGGNTDPAKLQKIVLDPVKPENLQMAEIGYRVNIFGGLYADINAFYGVYKNFIGLIRCVEPNIGDVDDSTGVAAINARNYKTYNIATNSKSDVPSYGGTVALTYYFGAGNSVYANYAYTKVDTVGLNDNLVAGFNTPPHKVNVGFNIDNIWKGIGFSANFKWMDKFVWTSAFTAAVPAAAKGVEVPANHWLDLQISYKIPKAYSVVRIGGSNIYNNRKVQAGGGPLIGATYYIAYMFDIGKL